ncbi:MAG: hypothetical protein SPL13_05255 [Clostridia bacterium]|nr:hypothetical protein [Clostridia bacterium]
MEEKTLKQYCKDAKNRLKKGFWQNYKKEVELRVDAAKKEGVPESKVKEYCAKRTAEEIKFGQDDEFYQKVKAILEKEGEVSDAIGRLTDKEYFDTLSYEEKQRYTLTLSEKYVKAVERYHTEKSIKMA